MAELMAYLYIEGKPAGGGKLSFPKRRKPALHAVFERAASTAESAVASA